jgi:hypothetical protein
MASPHRSESFQDDPSSPSILLVPTGDGDSFEVVLGPVLTLMRSEEASSEQEGLLAVEPTGDGSILVAGEPSHIPLSLDEQPLMLADGTVSPESSSSWVEGLTEQATADHDYELDEGWLEEQLLDSPDVEAQASEGPVDAHVSPGTSHLLYYFLMISTLVYLCLLFCSAAEPSMPSGPPEATDMPTFILVPPVSGDEAIGQIFSSFISSLIVIDCLTCLFCCRCHTRGCETRSGHLFQGLHTGS